MRPNIMSVIDRDPGIICFQHCDKNLKVFAFKFPETCSVCHKNLSDTELRIPPFLIPYPFRNACGEPNVLVIKPTVGDFLNTYENSSDLHIGVTDSKGSVYEFDASGKIKSSGKSWTQCLPIKIIKNITTANRSHWDTTLNEVFFRTQWNANTYESDRYNCYTFVLTFLRALQLEDIQPFLINKTTFCEEVIASHTRIAAKYISLYRQVKANNIVVQ